MKIHWGIFAFGLFGSFALFMIGLVIFASMQTTELVNEDYYEKELEFIDVLKKEENSKKLTEQLNIKIEDNKMLFSFPKEITHSISGNIIFFKPSHQNDDKNIPFNTDKNLYALDISQYSSGMYKVKIDWKANDIEYYSEKQIVLP